MNRNILSFLMFALLLEPTFLWAQDNAVDSLTSEHEIIYRGDLQKPKVELFAGANLHLNDQKWDHLYDVLLYVTPGMKWNIGKGWKLAAQIRVPIVNYGYGSTEWIPSPGVVALSKEFNWSKVDMKISGGLFSTNISNDRYGFDAKMRYMPCNWLGLEAQVGVTGDFAVLQGWQVSYMDKVVAIGGVDLYLRKWNTEARLRGGRFMYQDCGGQLDVMRHFNHCSVGAYVQVTNLGKGTSDYNAVNGGFSITMMIPPYHYKKYRKVRFRPASNFLLGYNMRGGDGCRIYNTDPEENPRNGWFDHTAKQWEKK